MHGYSIVPGLRSKESKYSKLREFKSFYDLNDSRWLVTLGENNSKDNLTALLDEIATNRFKIKNS